MKEKKKKKNPPIEIMPIIHPYNMNLERYINNLREIMGEIKILGLGGLIGFLKINDQLGLMRFLIYMRKKFPKAFIHCFGLGSKVRNIAYLCGMDSADSTYWIKDSMRSRLRIPFSNNFNLKSNYVKKAELTESECDCEICRLGEDNVILNSFTLENEWGKINRIHHNLRVSQLEIRNLRSFCPKDLKKTNLWEEYNVIRQIKDDVINERENSNVNFLF
jgi:queuine/archaeosine tRNA-ribosyltransferase